MYTTRRTSQGPFIIRVNVRLLSAVRLLAKPRPLSVCVCELVVPTECVARALPPGAHFARQRPRTLFLILQWRRPCTVECDDNNQQR